MSSIRRRPGFLLALGLCAVGGVVTLLGHLVVGPMARETPIPLNNVAGIETCPSFSPDGKRLAYSGRGGGSPAGSRDPFHIWVRTLPKGVPQQLTEDPDSDLCPVWSPDGANLAFVRLTEEHARYMVKALSDPAEKVVADTEAPDEDVTAAALSWMPDGKSLAVAWCQGNQPPAIFTVAVATGAAKRLTTPPAGSAGDSSPAVSPDGGTLAFVRRAGGDTSDVWLCDAGGGGLRQLTFDGRAIRGIAWTADGRDLVYASNKSQSRWQLWRIPAFGGSPRELPVGARQASNPAIAPTGQRLAYTETPSTSAIWLAALSGANRRTHPALRSAGREAFPSWSPDGRQIAWVSDQSGADEIWISDAAGANRAQVTNLKSMALDRPRWSPDGRTLLFATRGMARSIYIVEANARMARPQPQPLADGAQVNDLSWSHDGRSVYAATLAAGFIFKLAHGLPPRQLTQRLGARQPEESPDGKYVYYRFRRSIWRLPADGGAEEEVLSPEQFVVSIQPGAGGVYYMSREGRGASIWFYDFGEKNSRRILDVNDTEVSRDATFDVSPDGRYVLYPRIDRSQTDLVLVENFR